ncbi:MAG: DinB family protein [Pseudomonadota bacterium]
MSATTYFRAQAFNNAWANHRLLTACKTLPEQELSAKRASFFPSIIHTLNHVLTVDWYYLSGLEGSSLGVSAFEPEIPYTEIVTLAEQQRQADRRLIDFCDALTDQTLTDSVEHQRATFVQTERVDRTLLHLFQHQVHHRGQVHAMLSDTSTPTPQLDEFFLDHEQERALRASDFAALGFTEEGIWTAN